MDKILSNEVVEDILTLRLSSTTKPQKCSFIMPDGNYLEMFEHYEAYKFLVVEQLVPCIPDAEQLLSDLGYVRYSWIGYLTLPDKKLSKQQYKALEEVLLFISSFRDEISVQVHSQPKLYINYSLDDIPNIIKKIKYFYTTGKLLP